MSKKRIFITEEQAGYISESKKWNVDTDKVRVIVKYLDKGFKRGKITSVGEDGYPKDLKIVAMLSTDGVTPMKNMTAKQLFYLLQDRFSKMFADAKQRDSFLWAVMSDWYDKKITPDGLLSKNRY